MSVSSGKLFCDFWCTGNKAHILSWPTKPLYDYVSLCLSAELIPPCPLFQPRWSHFGSLKVLWPFQPQSLSEILSPLPTFHPLHMHAHFGFFSLGFRLNVTTPRSLSDHLTVQYVFLSIILLLNTLFTSIPAILTIYHCFTVLLI